MPTDRRALTLASELLAVSLVTPTRDPAVSHALRSATGGQMTDLQVRPLDVSTWPDFARVMEAHNGVWGGCWCIAFHPARRPRSEADPANNRPDKEALVRAGEAHAALVYDGADVVGWAQFGSVDELPRIKHRRAYDAGAGEPPDWRITCFFVASTHRKRGGGLGRARGCAAGDRPARRRNG
ncbi:hypothetical protein GCM10010531_09640 [Blastococcus jejuensis]|uniref:N-acetyltransferase domain-containing protein n=2 Tax=Blastococcus jejuensis TaxID=351224 RepID=A0ABP6NWS6_9ACTN